MSGVSGCFGSLPKPNETIDDVAEVSATVDGIIDTIGPTGIDEMTLLAQHYAMMTQRVRLLTWAVVVLAAFILTKELL